MGTLLVWLSSTEENNSQSQQEIPVLQELLGEQGPAHSCLWQLAQDRLELCLVHYNKGKEEKIKILCYCLCNPLTQLFGRRTTL